MLRQYRPIALLLAALLLLILPAASDAGDLDHLVRQLQSKDVDERIDAARALRDRSPHIDDAMPALAAALSDEYFDVRSAAAAALHRAGEKSVGLLAATLEKDDYYSQYFASTTLHWIGPDAQGAVPALGDAVESGGLDVKCAAARAIAATGDASQVGDQLVAQLVHENAGVRRAMVEALKHAGPEAVPALTDMLDHNALPVRLAAAEALGNLGVDAAPAADAMVEVLRQQAEAMKRRMGPMRNDTGYNKTMRNTIRSHALPGAIARLGAAALPATIECLDPSDPALARWAVSVVGRMGPDAAPAVPALVALWQSRAEAPYTHHCMRSEIAGAIGSVGPRAAGAIPALVETFMQVKPSRMPISYTLSSIGKPAVPALIALLKEDDAEARRIAIDTLARMGGQASDALPALRKCLKDSDEAVRGRAKAAISQIEAAKSAE